MSKELTDAIVGMREDEAMRLVAAMLDAGADPADVLEEAKGAMTVLGDKFECEEVFIPELIMGGEIMKGIAGELKPRIKGEAAAGGRGTIVLGTVAGDIHDIGKDVVVTHARRQRLSTSTTSASTCRSRSSSPRSTTSSPRWSASPACSRWRSTR